MNGSRQSGVEEEIQQPFIHFSSSSSLTRGTKIACDDREGTVHNHMLVPQVKEMTNQLRALPNPPHPRILGTQQPSLL